jgi:hypothetical protein
LFLGTTDGRVGEFTTWGGWINPSLISGLSDASGLALDGNGNIFVTDDINLGEYTTSGAVVNRALLHTPLGIDELIAVVVVPEPSTVALMTFGLVLLVYRNRNRL